MITIECNECGGVFVGNWELVTCRKCGHSIDPVKDVHPEYDEVVRFTSAGVLAYVTVEVAPYDLDIKGV